MPDTPTATEAGYDALVQQSRAVVAPKGTPQDVLDRLRASFQKSFADKRPTYMPDTPTAKEAGYNAPVQQSRAIVAPKGTPKEVVDRLRAAFQKSFAEQKYKDFNTQRMLTPNEVDGPTLLKQWTGSLDMYRKLVDQYKLNLSGKA
jgi:tripartite-type tricarboxylate transporter receptor subunit TctC